MNNLSVVKKLLNKVSTPLYLYDMAEIENKFALIKKSFPQETQLYYSMKANPNISLIHTIQPDLDGIEVASMGELSAVIENDLNVDKVIFHGPVKCKESLVLAIKNNIFAIVIDSLNEIEQISMICHQLNKTINVMIRINPLFSPEGYQFISSGETHIKLGIVENEVPNAIEKIKNASDKLTLIGFHCYLGSRILDNEAYQFNIRQTIKIFTQYIDSIDSDTISLAFASGIGETYYPEETSFCFKGIKQLIKHELNMLAELSGKKINHILELGSFLVVDAGYYITKVINIKHLNNKNSIITDGGINHNLSCLYRSTCEKREIEDSHPIQTIRHNIGKENKRFNYDIFGPICSEVDCLAKNISLPKIEIGDYIVATKSGAYCLTDSVVLFLSNGIPAEYLLHNDEIMQIKPRQSGTQYLKETYQPQKIL